MPSRKAHMAQFTFPLPRWCARLAVVFGLLTVVALLIQGYAALEQAARPGDAQATLTSSSSAPMMWVMLPFLIAFALFKGAIAINTQLTMRYGGPAAQDLLAQHGSLGNVRQWMVYKYAAALMAVIASAVIAAIMLSAGSP